MHLFTVILDYLQGEGIHAKGHPQDPLPPDGAAFTGPYGA